MRPKEGIFIFSQYGKKDNFSFYFDYEFLNRGKKTTYRELLIFPFKIPRLTSLVKNVLFNVHLMLGISYWKLQCSKNILINSGTLNKNQSEFWNTVYTKGLGEFFYKNKIDYRNLVSFPYDDYRNIKSEKRNELLNAVEDRSLVFLGGGKDSIVTIEQMKKHKKNFLACIIETNNNASVIKRLAKKGKIPHVLIKRSINTSLLTQKKTVYSGHVPFTAILSWIGYLYSVLFGYRYIVASCEKSSNEGNTSYLGMEINHQWSKSIEYENLFRNYVKRFLFSEILYFSLLRDLTELQISAIFSRYTHYDAYVTSCNRNFSLSNEEKKMNSNLWCGSCPKCAFTFLMFAPFMKKERLIRIFGGKNVFQDKKMFSTYEKIFGVRGNKPFECVGTVAESKQALKMVREKGEFNDSFIIQRFANLN